MISKRKSLTLVFQYADALELNKAVKETFPFIYDISLFHHIKPSNRKEYANQISKRLAKNGKFILCALDFKDKYFKGQREKFSPETNTTMYPVDKHVIAETFKELFEIEEIKKVNFGKEYKKKRWIAIMRGLNE